MTCSESRTHDFDTSIEPNGAPGLPKVETHTDTSPHPHPGGATALPASQRSGSGASTPDHNPLITEMSRCRHTPVIVGLRSVSISTRDVSACARNRCAVALRHPSTRTVGRPGRLCGRCRPQHADVSRDRSLL